MQENTIVIAGKRVRVRTVNGVRALNRSQASKYLRMAPFSLEKRAIRGELAQSHYGREVLYALCQLDAIKNNQPVPVVPEWSKAKMEHNPHPLALK